MKDNSLPNFTILFNYTEGSAHVDFKVYEIIGTNSSGNLYQRKDSSYSPDIVESTEEAETYLEGSVKWDGCSNINFFDNGYAHFCGMNEALRVGLVLQHIYMRCAEILKVKEKGNEELYY